VWLVFMLVLVGVDLFHSGWLATPFALTYPWLADHRLGQVTSIAANLLGGAGLASSLEWLLNLRLRRTRPTVWRRLAIGVALLLGFFAEGDAVSVYKRLADGVQLQIAFTTDDRAAMAWLRGQPRSGEVLLNDAAADAGIWAPYKAGIPILLPRIGGQGTSVPADAASVCDLHVGYVYRGSKTFAADSRTLPPVEDLERAPNLEEVFRSGDAAIFRVRLPCA
jgi:hypothetical protein